MRAGAASVNVCTGELLFERSDINIGAGNYAIGISHVFDYQSQTNMFMGNHWKLNIQQKIESRINLQTGVNEYFYTDSSNYIHEFEMYHSYNENGKTIKKYFDKTGLNLTLWEKSGERLYIEDPQGGKLVFNNEGILKEIISAANSEIIKKIDYDYSGARLSEIYDSRKSSRKIQLFYDIGAGLITHMQCIPNQNSMRKNFYYYDKNKNLTQVMQFEDGNERNAAFYKYDNSNRLQYAVCAESNSALKFEYDEANRIQKVSTGTIKVARTYEPMYERKYTAFASDDIYIGDVYCGEHESKFIGYDMNYYYGDFNCKNFTTFKYKTNSTIITNEKGIAIEYFFNNKGFTTAVLEVNNGDANDLKSLKKIQGRLMISAGTDMEAINEQKAHVWQTDTDISTANIMANPFNNVLKDYRSNKCRNFIYYTCIFWLKMNHKLLSSKITLDVNSGNNQTESGTISIDNNAVGSWQFVSIPIHISNTNLNSINMKFADKSASKTFKIADMRFCYSPYSKFSINDETYETPIDNILQIKYTQSQLSEVTKDVSEDFYMSEKDLQATYISFFKAKGFGLNSNNFELSCCDCTKKILVKAVRFYDGTRHYQMGFNNDAHYSNGKGNRAGYFYETKSPDGDTFTYGLPYFLKNENIGGKQVDCMMQAIEGNKYTKGSPSHKESHTRTYMDFQGKILMEQDEYGVQSTYSYDSDGNLERKEVSHPEITEKLIYTAQVGADSNNELDYGSKSEVETTFDSPWSEIKSVKSKGIGESDLQSLITNYSYNLYNYKVNSVTNNLGASNHFLYEFLLDVLRNFHHMPLIQMTRLNMVIKLIMMNLMTQLHSN